MKKSKKIITIILVIAIIAVLAVLITNIVHKSKYNVKTEQIELGDVKYFLLEQNQKYGVIDSDGNVVIEPKYQSVQIPNPTKGFFITYESEDSDGKVYNEKNENILTNYSDVEAIDINQLSSLVPFEKTVLKYKDNNMYGLIDFDGNKITDAIYEEIQGLDYKEGYLKVKQNGLYGAINIKGTEIVKIEYDNVSTDGYYNDKTKYQKAGFILRSKTDDGYKFGYMSYDGKINLETKYGSIERLTEVDDEKNIYLISSINGKYGLIKNNKQIIENDYIEIEYDKGSNLLVLNRGTASGVSNLEGKMIIPVDYDNVQIGGEYINAYKEEKRLVFDKDGKQLDTSYTNYEKVNNDYAIVIDEDNNYNIIDNNGNKKAPEEYVYIEYFTNNLFIATKGNKTGLISADGNVVIPMQYSTMQKISDVISSDDSNINLLQATDGDSGRIDLINSDGKVTKGIDNATLEKKSNYIVMTSDNDRKYFDFNGNEKQYKDIVSNNNLYATKKNNKWGFADSNGNMKINADYDFVTEFNKGYAGFKKDGKWGVIGEDGKVIKDASYSLEQREIKFLNVYYEINSGIGVPMYSGD